MLKEVLIAQLKNDCDDFGIFDCGGPPYVVKIAPSLAVAKYEVTFAQWDACVAYGDCEPVIDEKKLGSRKTAGNKCHVAPSQAICGMA